MQPEELIETFDQQASGYDKQSAKMAPIHDGLHFGIKPNLMMGDG